MTEKLPRPSDHVVRAIEEYLSDTHGNQRPAEKTAAVLAILAAIQEEGKPAPTRQALADAADCSKFTVDAGLSTRIAQGHVTIEIKTELGHVARRDSVVKHRYYRLADPLMSVYRRAKREDCRH